MLSIKVLSTFWDIFSTSNHQVLIFIAESTCHKKDISLPNKLFLFTNKRVKNDLMNELLLFFFPSIIKEKFFFYTIIRKCFTTLPEHQPLAHKELCRGPSGKFRFLLLDITKFQNINTLKLFNSCIKCWEALMGHGELSLALGISDL